MLNKTAVFQHNGLNINQQKICSDQVKVKFIKHFLQTWARHLCAIFPQSLPSLDMTNYGALPPENKSV